MQQHWNLFLVATNLPSHAPLSRTRYQWFQDRCSGGEAEVRGTRQRTGPSARDTPGPPINTATKVHTATQQASESIVNHMWLKIYRRRLGKEYVLQYSVVIAYISFVMFSSLIEGDSWEKDQLYEQNYTWINTCGYVAIMKCMDMNTGKKGTSPFWP